MTDRVQLLRMMVLSMVIALGMGWSMPRLSGQAQPSVALVVDDTGSMTQEMPGVQIALREKIATLQTDADAAGNPFPLTVLITFKDDVTTRLITNDTVQLLAAVDSLVPTLGADCPESSIAALVVAAQMLEDGGELNLWTDADSRPDGPDITAVESIALAKGFKTPNYHVSADCTAAAVGAPGEASAFESALSANHDPAGEAAQLRDSSAWTAAALETGPVLGIQSSFETFSTLARVTNGTFIVTPKASLTSAEGKTRYINASANMMFTSVLPTVVIVTPPAVPQNSAVTVELTGGRTNFQSSSTVSVGGTGVTVLSHSVLSPTRMLVNLAVSASAAPGFRDVTVTTNLGAGTIETARGVGPLQITTPPPAATIVGITPSQIVQGATSEVTITGTATHFVNGTSTVSLGTGVTVNRVTVSSTTALTANVTVGAAATIGFRDVRVTTGAEIASESVLGPLLVAAAPRVIPRILTATPASSTRGKRLSVTLTGENTHFGGATTVAFSGTGVKVDNVTVNSATSLTVAVTVASDAVLGFKDIRVTTGSEAAVLFGGFNTVAGTTHDLVVDFGPPSGLWLKAGRTGTWTRLSPLSLSSSSAKSVVTGDLDGNGIDEVIADFGRGKGIWVYANDSNWYQLDPRTVNRMVTGDLDGNGEAELIVDIPAAGIWVWENNTSWSRLEARNSTDMATGDLDGNGMADLIVVVHGFGIWAWANNATWIGLNLIPSQSIVVDDFDGNGNDDVVADFAGLGIWKYTFKGSWSLVLPVNASHLAAGDVDGNGNADLIVDFGKPFGIWIAHGGTWSTLHGWTSKDLLASDLDNNGKAEIIANFGVMGLWEYRNNADWIELSPLVPGAMAAGHIKEP